MKEVKGKYTNAKIMTDELEPQCLKQIEGMINHPVFTEDVVIMPDTHAGKGSVIGFTMPLTDQIIPNIIGVDIGCGMLSTAIGNSLPDKVEKIDRVIQDVIPMGKSIHSRKMYENLTFSIPNKKAESFCTNYNKLFGTDYRFPEYNDRWLKEKMEQISIEENRFFYSVGSLGGGNHFVEIGENQGVFYLTLHSGSRNFGARIADYWQRKAISLAQDFDEEVLRHKEHKLKRKSPPINKDLSVLSGLDMMHYFSDMIFAQYYASLNRHTILHLILEKLNCDAQSDVIESVHNFIDFDDLIIRKGAIRSYINEKMIIPFNMRDGVLICEGKSNADWNFSAPHGAGRVMSRSKAKASLELEDFKKSMKGVYSSCINKHTLDESPMVYKNAQEIENLIQPTARVLYKIKPILNIKAVE
jgi:tRNA-splicing ligase RtcB